MRLSINHTKNILDIIAEFLGIEFDSNFMQARFLIDKLIKTRNLFKNLLNRATVSRKELETTIKFLSFVAKIVILGRAFLRRFFDAISRSAIIIRIITVIRKDLL